MRKMKQFLSLIFVLLIGFSFAQSNALDAEADELLKKVKTKYQQYNTAKIELDLTIDLPEVEEDRTENISAWMSGDKFKIELSDQIIISDNVTLWNYLKEYNEVQINDYSAEDEVFSPSILFNFYNDDYIFRLKEEYKNSAGQLIKIIELTPVNKDQAFFKIDLSVKAENAEIVAAKIYERSGMRYVYTIRSFSPNIDLGPNFFQFDESAYDEISVIDSRM